MKKIKRLEIYTDKTLSSKKLLLVSDMHTLPKIRNNHLSQIKEDLKDEFADIDFIVIPGDIVNDANDLQNPTFKNQVRNELKEFLDDKKTIVSPGNHDQMTLSPSKKHIPANQELIYDCLSNIPNLHVLRNGKKIKVNEIVFSAFTPTSPYFTTHKENMTEYAKQFYNQYQKDLLKSENYNIFLTHEPQSIIKLSKIKKECIQPNADLVVSGHMHNCLLPNFLHSFFKNRGLLSPQFEIFPEFAQGTYQIGDTNFVINGAVNLRVETPIINNLYGYDATIIDIKNKQQKIKK